MCADVFYYTTINYTCQDIFQNCIEN